MKHIHGGGGGEIECRLSVVVANGPECLFRYRAKRRVTRWCRVIRVIRNFSFSLQLEGNHALFDRITCFFLFIVDWITEPPLSGFFLFPSSTSMDLSSVPFWIIIVTFVTRWASILIGEIRLLRLWWMWLCIMYNIY